MKTYTTEAFLVNVACRLGYKYRDLFTYAEVIERPGSIELHLTDGTCWVAGTVNGEWAVDVYASADAMGEGAAPVGDIAIKLPGDTRDEAALVGRIATEATLFLSRGAEGQHAAAKPIKAGDEVRIKPEWQDDGDADFRWFAIEDEDGGRVRIQPQIPGMAVLPNQVVEATMIERLS